MKQIYLEILIQAVCSFPIIFNTLAALLELQEKKEKNFFMIIMLLVGMAGINIFFIRNGMDYIDVISCSFFTTILPICLYFYILSKNRGFYFFFVFLSENVFNGISNIISYMTAFYLQNNFIVQILIRILTLSGIAWVVRRQIRPAFLFKVKEKKQKWGFFCLFPLFLTVSQFTIQMQSSNKIQTEGQVKIPYLYFINSDEIFSIVFITFCIIAGYLPFIFNFYFSQQFIETEKRDLILQKNALENKCLEYAQKEQELKIVRHDMKHHLRLIMVLIQERKEKEAIDYIIDKYNILNQTNVKTYCEDVVVNAVLSLYSEQAEKEGIECIIKLELIEKLPVSGNDFAVIIANVFENAIYAVNKLEKEKRKINLWIQTKNNQLALQIINPYQGRIWIGKDGKPYSLKKGHGLGTKSIARFEKKYHCIIDYQITGMEFQFRLFLNKQKQIDKL